MFCFGFSSLPLRFVPRHLANIHEPNLQLSHNQQGIETAWVAWFWTTMPKYFICNLSLFWINCVVYLSIYLSIFIVNWKHENHRTGLYSNKQDTVSSLAETLHTKGSQCSTIAKKKTITSWAHSSSSVWWLKVSLSRLWCYKSRFPSGAFSVWALLSWFLLIFGSSTWFTFFVGWMCIICAEGVLTLKSIESENHKTQLKGWRFYCKPFLNRNRGSMSSCPWSISCSSYSKNYTDYVMLYFFTRQHEATPQSSLKYAAWRMTVSNYGRKHTKHGG